MLVMNKKTIRTVLLTIIIVLLIQFVYVKNSSLSSLLKLTTSIKDFPSKEIASLPTITNRDFEILEVKTGLSEASVLWFPVVFVKLKNVSNTDITKHHELKVVYVDKEAGDIINQADCDISGSTLLFPEGTQKKFKLSTPFNLDLSKEKYKKEMKNAVVNAKLYLDNELIGTYPVESKVINFKRF